jgi:hypothetical protein
MGRWAPNPVHHLMSPRDPAGDRHALGAGVMTLNNAFLAALALALFLAAAVVSFRPIQHAHGPYGAFFQTLAADKASA